MALHTRLFAHNILRVPKLKQWSCHTTQAIERNSEKSTITCCPQTTSGTGEEDKQREADLLHADCWLPFPPFTQRSLHHLDTALPACHPPMHKGGDSVETSQSVLDRGKKERLNTLEKSLMVGFPQDYLPLVVKPVRYTSDDIMACPSDRKNCADQGTVYENHTVTVLTERMKAPQQLLGEAKDISHKTGLCHSGEWDSSAQGRIRFRRHSVGDSNPTCCGPHSSDCSVLQSAGSGTVFCTPASDLDEALSRFCAGSDVPQGSGDGQKSVDKGGQGPSLDQLRAVETFFIETLPKFFKSRIDYSVYHPEIVFENNFWGENQVSVGINQYAIQLTKLRALTHLKYAHVHMEVVSSACVAEEGVIRVQWRIVGLSQLKALRFWKYTAWSYSKAFREDAEWIDGISVLHVNKDGLVTKHRIDRMSPSEEQLSKAPSLAAKLALLLGLSAPKPSLSDCSSLLCRR